MELDDVSNDEEDDEEDILDSLIVNVDGVLNRQHPTSYLLYDDQSEQ